MRSTSMTILLLLHLSILSACGEKADDSDSESEGIVITVEAPEIFKLAEMADIDKETLKVRQDLLPLFCEHVFLLPLQKDFTFELSELCLDGMPTEKLHKLDKIASRFGDDPKPIEFGLKHDGDYTEAFYAAAYHLPIPPKWVRKGRIPHHMMSAAEFGEVKVNGTVTMDRSEEIGGDLQFGKYDLTYNTDVQTPDNKPFLNSRNTNFDAYQVHGGNPDIGIGAEYMTDEPNPDFEFFNGLTLTIGTEDGGSLLITIIRSRVKNNGYQELARNAFAYTTYAQATRVRSGLLEELQSRMIPEETL